MLSIYYRQASLLLSEIVYLFIQERNNYGSFFIKISALSSSANANEPTVEIQTFIIFKWYGDFPILIDIAYFLVYSSRAYASFK